MLHGNLLPKTTTGLVRLTLYPACSASFSVETVFFSHNNSARTVFFSQFQPKFSEPNGASYEACGSNSFDTGNIAGAVLIARLISICSHNYVVRSPLNTEILPSSAFKRPKSALGSPVPESDCSTERGMAVDQWMEHGQQVE